MSYREPNCTPGETICTECFRYITSWRQQCAWPFGHLNYPTSLKRREREREREREEQLLFVCSSATHISMSMNFSLFSHTRFHVNKLHVDQSCTISMSICFSLSSHASHSYSHISFPCEHCVEWWNARTFKSDSSV